MGYNKIKYFSTYGCTNPIRRRINSPAADSKKDYLIEVLNRIGLSVEHVSRCALSVPGKFEKSYVVKRGINTYRYFSSFGFSNPFLQKINQMFVHIQWMIWIFLHVKRGEQIMVYHSLASDVVFILLKRFKNVKIIGDIEEIYQDVHPQNKFVARNEYKFIEICDKLMYPNTLLNNRLNKNNRPYLICHGIYNIGDITSAKFDDGRIHLLYSGTFDPIKGGAFMAVKLADFLTDNYHLHITGFGDSKLIEDEIKKHKITARCSITYHGYISANELTVLMQKCHIGLCTQNPKTLLNLTSFPSKILNYMANGLSVVVGRNEAIESSYVGDLVYYYDEQDPKCIMKTISQIRSFDNTLGIRRLAELEKKLVKDMKELIEY